jgi:signal transduction histidine kinase
MINNTEQIQNDCLELIAKNLAHELRTSLVAVKSGIRGVKDYVPPLVEAYQEAVKHQLDVPSIQSRHINMLITALELAEQAAHCASAYVNMFAMNMSKVDETKLSMQNCSILECVQKAIDQYPCRSNEQKSLLFEAMQIENDFLFSGPEALVVNLIMNIFRNAIYRIQDLGSGKISISSKLSENGNHLLIRDSSKGVSVYEKEMMFTPFQQLHQHDLGMGLFFCKQLMNTLNGGIECLSEEEGESFKVCK